MMKHSPAPDQKELERLIKCYRDFILRINKETSISQLAQFILYTRSFNSFKSAILLAKEGLPIDCLNSLRLGLENGWLSILLKNDEHSALEWLTMVRHTNMPKNPRKNYRQTFGNLSWIRERISTSEDDKIQRDNIYKILSVRSHANVATSFFAQGNTDGSTDYRLYEPGGIIDDFHQHRCLKSVLFCLRYLLHDMERAKEGHFGSHWRYEQIELMHIANVIWRSEDGECFVDGDRINSAAQVTFLIALSTRMPKEVFEKLKKASEIVEK